MKRLSANTCVALAALTFVTSYHTFLAAPASPDGTSPWETPSAYSDGLHSTSLAALACCHCRGRLTFAFGEGGSKRVLAVCSLVLHGIAAVNSCHGFSRKLNHERPKGSTCGSQTNQQCIGRCPALTISGRAKAVFLRYVLGAATFNLLTACSAAADVLLLYFMARWPPDRSEILRFLLTAQDSVRSTTMKFSRLRSEGWPCSGLANLQNYNETAPQRADQSYGFIGRISFTKSGRSASFRSSRRRL